MQVYLFSMLYGYMGPEYSHAKLDERDTIPVHRIPATTSRGCAEAMKGKQMGDSNTVIPRKILISGLKTKKATTPILYQD